jgi:hypothetical protein
MIGQPYSGKLTVRLDERRVDMGDHCLLPTLHAVVVFSRESDARKVLAVLPKRFARYGLTLHPEKTRLVRFGKPSRRDRSSSSDPPIKPETFDLLGFTHYWGLSRRGYWVVKRRTAKDRYRKALRRIALWCRDHRHDPIQEQQRMLSLKLRGHYAYYGITGNAARLQVFWHEVFRIWRYWLCRRSRKARLSWDAFNRLTRKYPLPTPVAVHSIYRRAASP